MIKLNGYEIKPTIFPDGTSQVWKVPEDAFLPESSVYWDPGKDTIEAEFMWLAQLRALMHAQSIRVSLDIRYLPYARQDKIPVSNHVTFALWSFVRLLNSLAFESIRIWDPHSELAIVMIGRSKAVYFREATALAFADTSSDVVCYPDAGAAGKYVQVHAMPHVNASKVRDQSSGAIYGCKVDGDVSGKRVLIVDDICDGGATFIALTKALREAGATDVSLFVSHGLFTRGTKPLFDAGISRIFTPEKEVTQ
jgi:ribose-phosphate pyrophosphokinase